MIDPQWQMVDLDPVTWRNLGPYLQPQRYIAAAQPDEHGLFILHEQGQVLKVVDTLTRTPPIDIPTQISDPETLAQTLYARGAWERVHIIDRAHLAWVGQQAQATPRRDLPLDAYYHLVSTLIWGKQGGYVCVPPHPGQWHGWTYADIRRFMAALPNNATLALGVYADGVLSMGLILVCQQGKIRKVTTFEGLDETLPNPAPTLQTLSALREALTTQFAPPAAILLCTEAAFSGWLDASDKAAYLLDARDHQSAIWHYAALS